MPDKITSLDGHVQSILEARGRRAAGRFRAVPEGTEMVRDVVVNSCGAVADAFAAEGFRWSKSALEFSRKVGPFKQVVSFQSDSANASGHYVAVAMHARVKSTDLKKWRELNYGVGNGDNVWGTQVGYLAPEHEYLKWQLVDSATRKAEIDSMIDTVRNLVLPAFAVCSSRGTLAAGMLERREITCVPDWATEIAIWVQNRDAAQSLVKLFFEKRPDLLGVFHAEYERQRQTPLFAIPADRFRAFVRLCVDESLEFPCRS
jgi:hypothetical protein